MNKIEVIHTPALLPLYELKDKVVVVIDILRATSTMCVAFKTGVKKILPVANPDECRMFKEFDFIIAAERNAVRVEGFDMGNSPFEYENPILADRNIAFTTTNGTKAIKMAKAMEPHSILIGSFLNLSALCSKIKDSQKDLVLLCSGWKDKYNLEDTLFAGAVIEALGSDFEISDDAAISSHSLFVQHQDNLEALVRRSSHANRFSLLHLQTDDVKFCLQTDAYPVVPFMEGEFLVCE
ncbi:MAG: 2-phosphosulfolactate phosphatase [Bacteroidetes bacterium B1(2017)]|nr:MAG: 2-phosphosulfolactate phosphatase [Bacteroidetes bacterium B1(2017)]